jgi:sugar lactone lactonase YvrE
MITLSQRVEGIAVGPTVLGGTLAEQIFVVSAGTPPAGGARNLFIIPPTCSNQPCLRTTLPINGLPANANLLGLAFTRETTPRLVVADGNTAQVWFLTIGDTAVTASVAMTIPAAQQDDAFLNAITFDGVGRIYVSDSGNGIIWRATLQPNMSAPATEWSGPNTGDANGLLMPPTAGTPQMPGRLQPFVGANGIGFSNGGSRMFVANTGFRNIIQIPVTNGTAGTPFILATGINGPDGIAVQTTDPGVNRVWVAANQSDEIVIIDGTSPTTTPGRVIHKMGDFNGITNGAPNGLLFPASVVFSNDGQTLYVTNFAFTQAVCPLPPPAPNPGPPCNPPPSIDSAWTQKVTAFTVVKFERIIEFTPLPFP